MITITITAQNQYSDALYKSRGENIGFSIQTVSAWTGTIELQRLPEENSANYYNATDDGWITFLSKTADYNADTADLAPGWFRIKATTGAISGRALCKIW